MKGKWVQDKTADTWWWVEDEPVRGDSQIKLAVFYRRGPPSCYSAWSNLDMVSPDAVHTIHDTLEQAQIAAWFRRYA